MKRITRTLTAATMAGAVAFAAVPAAQAQTPSPEKVVQETLPQAIQFADGTYKELVDGYYVDAEFTGTEEERALLPIVTDNGDNWVVSFQTGREPLIVPKPATTTTAQVPAGSTATVNAPVAPEGSAASETTTVLDTTIETTVTNTDAAPAGGSSLSGGAIAGIAAAALIPIVIAGVTYYLNQDGQTLVGSSDRVNQQPTPEEKAESDRLRAEHADEIAAQEEAAAEAARGISAETGSNTLVRTLFALLIAVVLGSAAFVAGRRFLV